MFVKNVYNFEKKIENIGNHNISVVSWYILKYYLNLIAPIYYKFSKIKEQENVRKYTGTEVIVSLTTFPARMKTLPIVLESLFRQTVKPDKIILWLADTQFSDKNKVNLKLHKFITLGLNVEYCEDLRSHKKYYYSMKNNPDAIVITVDDDIIYPEDMIEELLKTYLNYPNKIICNRAHLMKKRDGQLLPYNSWTYRAKGYSGVNIMFCPTGCAGILYPPHSLSEYVFDKEVLKKICFFADDIWLKCMGYLNGTEVVLTGKDNPEVIDVIGANKMGLAKLNVEEDFNTKQLKEVSKYYRIEWSKLK